MNMTASVNAAVKRNTSMNTSTVTATAAEAVAAAAVTMKRKKKRLFSPKFYSVFQ